MDLWEHGVVSEPDHSNDLEMVISNILKKCRSIIKMIKKSSNLTSYMDKLKAANKIRSGLSIDCKSRWNSTKFMIDNMIKLKSLVVQLHSEKHDLSLTKGQKGKLTKLELTSDQWRMLMSINQVLTPFYNATKLMSGQKYSTIGTALFAIRKIKAFLETYVENNSFVNEMKNALLDQMIKYIDEDKEQMDLIIVNIIN